LLVKHYLFRKGNENEQSHGDYKKLASTQAGWSVSVMRAVLGWIFITEGGGKLYGWFGGGGWEATCAYFTKLGIPFPELNAFFLGGVELYGGMLLLVGLLTRLAALPIAITIIVAILTAHLGGSYNYQLLIIVICVVLMHVGGGSLSIDKKLGAS